MKNWIWFTPLCLLLILCVTVSFITPRAVCVPERDAYVFDVSVKENRLTARESVTVCNRTNRKQDALYFCLYANAFDDESRVCVTEKREQTYPGGFLSGKTEILRVCVNGEEADYTLQNDDEILCVPVKNYAPESVVTVQIDFSDTLPEARLRYGIGDITSNFGNWYPVLCPFINGEAVKTFYTPFGDPFCSESADYQMRLRAPKGFRLACTGVIESIQEDSFDTVWNVKAGNVRDFAFVLSRNFVLQSRHADDTLVYAYGMNACTQEALSFACDALSFFSEILDAYPYETFTVVSADLVDSGMEYPSMIMIDEDLFASDMLETLEETIVHETAHQWFYGIVGNDQSREAWLDEGLAQYATALYLEKRYGEKRYRSFIHESEWFVRSVLDVMKQAGKTADRRMVRETETFEHRLLYNAMCYDAPCVMFDSLRNLIGKTAFSEGLKIYVKDNAYAIAGKERFTEAMSRASGKRIESYIDPWLTGEVYWE